MLMAANVFVEYNYVVHIKSAILMLTLGLVIRACFCVLLHSEMYYI